jgi:hypothetical protein
MLHNEELHNLYASPNIVMLINSRKMRWANHIAHMGETRNAYDISVEKTGGKVSRGRRRRRCEDNIKMNLSVVEWEVVDRVHLA